MASLSAPHETAPRQQVRQERSRFFVWMGGLALLTALAGFLPTYWLPLVTGHSFPPILHIHGAILISWYALFFWQSLLVVGGRTADHRQWGLLGIAVATALVISVLLAVLNSFAAAARIGMEPQARMFASVSLLGIVQFAIFFTLAIRNVRRPDYHRRYIYAASVPMLQAAVARWFQMAHAAHGPGGPPPVFVAIPPGIVVWLLFFGPLVLHDRKVLGRLHPATIAGMASAMFVILAPLVIGPSAGWAAFMAAFAGLAPHG